MTNKKSTKKALILSVLSLVLCFSMLVGTTFAWFTDSVTSANNIIQSGNLDVDFKYWNGDSWETVEGSSDILNPNAKWEPGYHEVVYLKVENAGSLSLKYQLGVNIISEKAGVNVKGEAFKLSNYILFGAIEGVNPENNRYETRDEAINALKSVENKKISEGYTKASVLDSNTSVEYVALVIYMPETVGNEANHNGKVLPSISLGLNVVATQNVAEAETDSFGSDYDKDAALPGNSEYVNIDTTGAATEIVLSTQEVNGKTVILPEALVENLADDVTSVALNTSEAVIVKAVDDCVASIIYTNFELVDQAGNVIDLTNNTTPIPVTISVGDAFASGETVVVYHDGEIVATAVVNADGMISYEVTHFCEVKIDALETVDVNENGEYVISTVGQLVAFANDVNAGNSYEGKTVVLAADIDLNNVDWTPIGSFDYDRDAQAYANVVAFKGTFDGQNHTISNLSINTPDKEYGALFACAEAATIKNVKIHNVDIVAGSHAAPILARGYNYSKTTTVTNCHVTGEISIMLDWAYAGGIVAKATGLNISYCSVMPEGTGVITAANRNAVGGIVGWVEAVGASTIANCKVANMNLTGWANIGAINGYIQAGCTITDCSAENIVLTKTRVDGHPTIGLVAGGFSYNASQPVTITNNTVKNIIVNGTHVAAPASANILYGAEFSGNANSNFISENNVTENVTNNLVEVVKVTTSATLNEAVNNGAKNIYLADGEYTLNSLSGKSGITFIGSANAVIGGAKASTGFGSNFGTNNTFKNLTFSGTTNGVRWSYAQGGTTTFDNCTFAGGSTYGFHIDESGKATFIFNDCTFSGFNAFAGDLEEIEFNGCSFLHNGNYGHTNIWNVAYFNDCTWDEKSTYSGGTIYLDGACVVASADELATAVANGITNVYLADGEYNVANCGGKTLTVSGSKNAVIKIMNEGENGADYGFDGSNVTFNGVTIDTTANTGSYKGFARMNGTFNDCAFVGGGFTTFSATTFNNCTFNLEGYIWTWGATAVDFTECTFIGDSRTVLAHGSESTVITIKDCDFAATSKGYTGGGDWTAVVEIDPVGSNVYTINFVGENTISENYSGWTRVKDGSTGHTVNGLN